MRKLYAHEIDVRVGTVSSRTSKAMLLLYKDSRCDMAVLDEVYGAENWQCEFVFKDRKGVIIDSSNKKQLKILDKYEESILFCSIGVYNKEIGDWVWKSSNGVESQGTGSDDPNNKKGEASDAFKRAGFMWGIGRELYEWKDLWVDYDKDKDKYERFSVAEISYNEKNEPKDLVIVNKNNEIVYELRNGYYKKQPTKKSKHTQEKTTTPNTSKGDNKKSQPQADNEPIQDNQAKVKAINTKYYKEIGKNVLFELNKMKQKDELAHDIGDLSAVVKQQMDHYITKDLKLIWDRIQFVKGGEEVYDNYIAVDVDEAFKKIVENIISIYSKEDESEVY